MVWSLTSIHPVAAGTRFDILDKRAAFRPEPTASLRLQHPLHQPLEEQPLRKRERHDAGRHDDHVDRGDAGPGPLAHAALGRGGVRGTARVDGRVTPPSSAS